MTSHETAIAERLRDAADRIPVDTSVRPTTEVGGRRVVVRPPIRRRTVIAGAAVAAVASAAALIVVVSLRPTPETVTVSTASTSTSADGPADPGPPGCPPSPAAPTLCSPAVAAHLVSPPAWFGAPRGGFRGGLRGGRWVSMAIGRESAAGVTDPIVVSVFDGTYAYLGGAETVTIGGVPLRSIRFGDWLALVTGETPTVMVAGSVDEGTLSAVLDAVEVSDTSGELSLHLPSRPDGFTEIVPPRPLDPDHEHHRTLASASGDVGINEVSDSTDPLLAASGSGADLTEVDIDGTPGWIGETTDNPAGPLRFVVWSPSPGVVFEISSQDTQRSDQDLVDLAAATSTIDAAQWDALYVD